MIRVALSALVLAASLVAVSHAADKENQTPDRAELEKQFAETMSNCAMVGSFTSGDVDKPLKGERYTIGEVKKLQGDFWLFPARIQYGEHDLTVPLPLEVKWAGDTPVITLTKLNIPGLGTYTARVLIYDNQYVGTWSGGDHGGHLIGKIVKEKKENGDAEKK